MKKYFVFFAILLFPIFVNAGVTCSVGDYSAMIELEKEKLGVGDEALIAINTTKDYKVSYKVEDKSVINLVDNKVIALKEGISKISVSIDFILDEEVVNTCKTDLNVYVLGNDSSLKSLAIDEVSILSELFNSDTLTYDVNVPYSIDKITITAESNDSLAKITGSGSVYLNEGNNEFLIIVTAQSGNTTTYTLNVNRMDASDDSTLKSLIVEGYEFSPKFSKDVYEYTLNVGKDVESIKINAIPTYEFSKILGGGEFAVASGENLFYINVLAENGSQTKYKIIVNKSNGSSRLENLVVDGYKLDKEFDSNIFIYNLSVKSNVAKISVKPIASSEDQIEILGADKLEYGTNEVIIRVTSKDKTSTTYKIIVNRQTKEEEKIKKKNNILLNVLFVTFIIAIIIMVSLISIFIKRNHKKSNKKKLQLKIKK